MPGAILAALRERRFEPVVSWELIAEVVDVLSRARIRRYDIGDEDVDGLLSLLAPVLPLVDIEVQVRDPDDVVVVATAIAGHADGIVTGDRDLLDDGVLRAWLSDRGVTVMTSSQVLAQLDA